MLSTFLTGDALKLIEEKAKLLFMLNLHLVAWELLDSRANDPELAGRKRRRVRNQEFRGKKMTNRTYALIGLALAGMMGSLSASATVIYQDWCGAVSFNSSECTDFTPFEATELTKVTSKTATYGATKFNNVYSTTFNMYLRIAGDWTLIWTTTKTDKDNHMITDVNVVLPKLFTKALVSGIKFTAIPDGSGQEYTAFNMGGENPTIFQFGCTGCGTPPPPDDDDDTTPVPEPGTLALLGIGLAGLGLSRRRGLKKS